MGRSCVAGGGLLRSILDRYPPGKALDAACGTGRWGVYLSERGHVVRGVDESAHMLEVARAKLPRAVLSVGDLRSLQLPAASMDLGTWSCAVWP